MKKLKLTLYGEKGFSKTYEQEHVSGQKVFDYWDMLVKFEKTENVTPIEILKTKIEFVASLFDDPEVTTDTIIAGVDSWDLINVVDNLINTAVGGDGEDPKPEE